MTVKEEVLTLLGLTEVSTELTAKIDKIIDITTKRLLVRLGVSEVPAELGYIVVEVSVIRYNRTGSEGAGSHNIEGEVLSWASDDDFAAYADDISAWRKAQDTYRGKVRFI